MKNFSVMVAFIILSLMAASASPAGDVTPYPGDIQYGKTGQPVVFSHKAHVSEIGLECDACHTKIFELKYDSAMDKGDFTMDSLNAGKYCGSCHNGQTAFGTDDYENCDRCHKGTPGDEGVMGVEKVVGPREDITLGSGDSVAIFKHPAHDAIKCNVCHTSLFPIKKTATITSMDEINAGKSCGSCHNGQKAFEPSDCSKCHPKM